MQYIGIVVDNIDESHLGRCKIRILGKHTDKDENNKFIIPDENLPWLRRGKIDNNFSIPKLGTYVYCELDNPYSGSYFGELYPSDDVLQVFNNATDYPNSHILVYDTNLGNDITYNPQSGKYNQSNSRPGEYVKIYYIDSEGIVIDLKTKSGNNKVKVGSDNTFSISTANGATINIDNDNTIKIKTDSKIVLECDNIMLGGEDADKSVILGETFLNQYMNHTHTVTVGATFTSPVTPPPTQQPLTSKNIKIK